jgi:hypothetical protein
VAIETTDRVQLSETELDSLIDSEARKRMGISGAEFKRRYRNKDLPNTTAVRDIAMLLKLASKS